ncbi:hypothetical protein [Streptomyces sp. NBC_01443]|uniref:hypothetical protein n=1 Tax=Streptomyces sp. NBC_01443 TaxID=2903868 RepID=UPI0022586316|nr:hypothetical protein [Streptomyces sp. NBC_01443]MCX4626601.1 hypothetical protein [Streptomyces sp. NBC_01443]
MTSESNGQAARILAEQAQEIEWVTGREPWRDAVRWLTRGRLGRRSGPVPEVELNTPWQDTLSPQRAGWRQRAANLDGEYAFSVDYQICPACRLAWVEDPYTLPDYQRCGLASAGLAALRLEHADVSWHTLGGHFTESKPFWAAVGNGVPGGYEQRPLCPHVSSG